VIPHAHTLETTGLAPLPLPPEPAAPVLPCFGPIAYFKRFRMEADLTDAPAPAVPSGFTCVPWSPTLIDAHAEVLCCSFVGEVDAVVFASLGNHEGCRGLMASIVLKSGFLPEATLLLVGNDGPIGSVQGIRERRGLGAIQNLGVLPRYRGQGLGGVLLIQAMQGWK
jgi:hypothetical protein